MNQEESRQKQYPEDYQYQYQEDEISLIDCLRVLWKWKWLIITGTAICAVAAAVISLQMPRIYEVAMTIEPGIAGIKDEGDFVYIDSVVNISGKINEGVYDPKTVFKTNVGKYSNLIKVNSEWNEKDIELGLKASRQLIARISDDGEKVVQKRRYDYDGKISVKRDEISKIEMQEKRIDKQILVKQNEISEVKTQWERDTDKQVTLKLNSIKGKKNQIKLQQATLETIRQRIKELTLDVNVVKDNTEKMVKQKEILLKDNRVNDDLPLLLFYATTIQQNMVYSTGLNKQIYDLRTNVQVKEAKIEELDGDIDLRTTEIEELKLCRTEGLQTKIDNIRAEIEKLKLLKIEWLQAEIDDIKTQINLLTSEKEIISNIKIVQDPEVSPNPVKSKKKQIVLLATVVGLFFFIFLAFFIEYIRKASKSIRAGD